MTVPSTTTAEMQAEMQTTVDNFSTAWTKFDLTISANKTEVMYPEPAPDQPHLEPSITVKDKKLTDMPKFTYLDSTLSNNAVINAEFNCGPAQLSAG